MKIEEQVQRAHDLIRPITTGEINHGLPEGAVMMFRANLCVLCWVLEHQSDSAFEAILDGVEDHLKRLGYVFKKG